MDNVIYIDGLPLPASLVNAVRLGVWRTPERRDAWVSLFRKNEIGYQPMLYPLDRMQGKKSWEGLETPGFLGHRGRGVVPGDIDQSRAVLIGDLGPDRLIALDYRESGTRPSVIALTGSCWRKISEDIESFMRALGIYDIHDV